MNEQSKKLTIKISKKDKILEIEKNKKYKKQRSNLIGAESKEERMYYNYFMAFNDNVRHPHDSLLNIWEEEIISLKYMVKSKDFLKQRIGTRIIGGLSVLTYETAKSLESSAEYRKLLFIHQIRLMLHPEYPEVYLEVANYLVLLNEKRRAINFIDKAIKKGYSNKQALLENETFKNLIGISRFEKVIKKMDLH